MKIESNRPYHHGDLRRTVIDTAMDMLQQDKGWQFTLREVARRAGVSHTAPYRHFPDKAALLGELALIGFDRLKAALLATRPESATDTREALRRLAGAYLVFGEANPELYRLMFAAEADTSVGVHLDDRSLSTFTLVLEVLERGQREGAVRDRPARGLAAASWAQLHGLTLLSIDGLLALEKLGERPAEAALETLLDGLLV